MIKLIRFPLLSLLVLTIAACAKDAGTEADFRARLVDYQTKADAMEWWWSRERASLKYCITEHLRDYKAIYNEGEFGEGEFHIQDKDGEVFSMEGHRHTVFTRLADAIYVTQFSPRTTGCSLLAYNLNQRRQLWRTELKGIGPTDHSKYGNLINIELDEGAILVFGNEVHGRYIEYVDPESGKTLGHKKLPPKTPWPGDGD